MLVGTVARQPTVARAHVLLTGLRSTRPKHEDNLSLSLSPPVSFWFPLTNHARHMARTYASEQLTRSAPLLALNFQPRLIYTPHAYIPEKVS